MALAGGRQKVVTKFAIKKRYIIFTAPENTGDYFNYQPINALAYISIKNT